MSATRMSYPSAQPVYAAVEEWRDGCLLDDRSLFSGEPGSTLANGEELVRDFVEQPDAGSADFLTKLAGQLAQTSPGAVQLAAELLYVYLLPARSESVGGSTKREIINRVLDFAPGTAAVPDRLGAVLDAGLVRMGTAYGSYRWKLFAFLVEAFVALKRIPLEERRRVLSDPSAFVVLVDRLDDTKGGAIQKYALEHLLFPDHFSPSISADARRTILSRWAHLATPVEASEPVRLGNVHRALAAEAGHPDGFVDLWRAPWLWEWSGIDSRWETAATWLAWWKERAALDAEERDYKVQNAHQLLTIAHGVDPVAALDAFLAAETNLVDWRARDEFVTWAGSDRPAVQRLLNDLWNDSSVDALTRFQRGLPDDVLTQRGSRLSISSVLHMTIGVEQMPPWRAAYVDDFARITHSHRPEPTATDGEVYDYFLALLDNVVDLGRRRGFALRDRLDAQGLLYAAMKWPAHELGTPAEAAAIEAWRRGKKAERPVGPGPEPAPPAPAPPQPESLSDLAASLFLDETFLETIHTLLQDRRQLIFTGNPGTGKTYVARAFATWFAGSADRVRLVQFHPSYSYEDFVEGYRPREDGGFALRSGPLRTIAAQAAGDPDHNYVLVVDELNRGNVSRVFGELYFLLEYRAEFARLMYSDTPFALPPNLYLIGTMNSADRSIALLDSALRRRFSFVDFDPLDGPVAEVLDRYLAAHAPSMRWVAALVARANAVINDPLASIGPSHFLRADLTAADVARIWEHDVVPTLREHLYGQDELLSRLTFDALSSHPATTEIPDDDSVPD